MSANVTEALPGSVARDPKASRKPQPRARQYPYRVAFSIAPDQQATLERMKIALRASEAYVLRTALDSFARGLNLQSQPGVNNNGR